MAIDPSIVMGLQRPPVIDPLRAQAEALNLVKGTQDVRAGQQQAESGALDLQQKKQDIADQQTLRQIASETNGDIEELTKRAAGKVSPKLHMALQQAALEHKTKMAVLTKDDLANKKAQNELVTNESGALVDLPPDQQATEYPAAVQRLVAAGLVKPGELPAQYPGPEAIQRFHDIHQGYNTVFEHHIKSKEQERLDAEAARKATKENAEIPGIVAKSTEQQALTAGQLLGPVKSQPEWDAALAQLPEDVRKRYSAMYSPEEAKRASEIAMKPAERATRDIQAKNAENNVSEYELRLRAAKGDKDAAKTLKDAEGSKIRVAQVEAQNKWNLQMGSIASADGKPSEAAQAIANYQVPLQAALSRLPAPARELVLKQVRELNPNYDASHYDVARKTEMDATTGSLAKTSNSQSTAIAHMDVLNQAVDALKNGDIKILNQLGNALGVQVGKTPKTTFEAIVHKVGPELASAYLAGGGSVGERGATEKDFDPSLSPEQLKSNIAVSAKLLEGKIKANQEQYQRGTYGRGKQQLLTQEASDALKRLSGQSGNAPKNPYR